MRSIASFLLLGMVLFSVSTVARAETAFDAEMSYQAEVALEGFDAIEHLTAACPADIQNSLQSWWKKLLPGKKKWRVKHCLKQFESCLTKCVRSKEGSACWAVARIFEKYGNPDDNKNHSMARLRAFTLACAMGSPSGCTNRGAGIRNAPVSEDPFFSHYQGDVDVCLAETFEKACAARNAWGCAMSGQSYWFGEGRESDVNKARQQFHRTCEISKTPEKSETEAAPCRFAKTQLHAMDRAR